MPFECFPGIKLATEFHISLGRTVPIRIHQIDTMVHLLRRKFEGQKRFLVEFGTWEVFVNDDRTRSFLSLEVVATGYAEVEPSEIPISALPLHITADPG